MTTTTSNEVVTRFAELFRGRQDAYGTDDGGCDKVAAARGGPPWYDGEYRRRVKSHLAGVTPMGVYPIYGPYLDPAGDTQYVVRWGCADLDYNDPTDALNLQILGRAAGLDPWVERTRSGHWHVWFFASEWVPAKTMRHALLALYQKLEIRAKEVNPKQVELGPDQIGNYVRLPYPGILADPYPHYQIMVTINQDPYGLDRFLDDVSPRTLTAYETVATRYAPPPPPRPVKIGLMQTLDPKHPLVKHILEHGPRANADEIDRSDWLAYLAHVCHESDLTASEAYASVKQADDRWTHKFSDRPDGELRLMQMVERVYG